jgi:hypothetical protein
MSEYFYVCQLETVNYLSSSSSSSSVVVVVVVVVVVMMMMIGKDVNESGRV